MSKLPKTASRSSYVTSTMSGERVQAFVPAPLPPAGRTLDLASLQGILLMESNGKLRDRLFLYAKYLEVLNRDL